MNIEAEIDLNTEEKKQLSKILGCTQSQLNSNLAPYFKSASIEYLKMFLGQKVFTRGSDILEFRLYLLIVNAFNNNIPTEQQICSLFQISVNEARSLLKAVMSKYQYNIQSAVEKSMKKFLESTQRVNNSDTYSVSIDNKNIVEALNRQLISIDGTLQQIIKKPGTVSTYIIKAASRRKLMEQLGVAINEDE